MNSRYIIIFKEKGENFEFDCFGELCERIASDDWQDDIIAVIEVSQKVGEDIKSEVIDWRYDVDRIIHFKG
jgi:hypothetical protein